MLRGPDVPGSIPSAPNFSRGQVIRLTEYIQEHCSDESGQCLIKEVSLFKAVLRLRRLLRGWFLGSKKPELPSNYEKELQ